MKKMLLKNINLQDDPEKCDRLSNNRYEDAQSFVRQADGAIITFDVVPGARYTISTSINNSGVVVGCYNMRCGPPPHLPKMIKFKFYNNRIFKNCYFLNKYCEF